MRQPAFLLVLCLASCRDQAPETPAQQPQPEPKISYSREVRPYLIENCTSCHAELPLHNPTAWDLLHQHENPEEFVQPDSLVKWVEQGAEIDPHWAGRPLRKVEGSSIDDLVKDEQAPLPRTRPTPRPMFTAPVPDLLAGDLMDDPDQAISTGYLRQGDDSPEWRIEKVAREFLGVNISCAKCHDHPSEHWSTARYQHLRKIFTTPYDSLPEASPPLYVRETNDMALSRSQLKTELERVCAPLPFSEEKFQEWLTTDGSSPQIPGLVAAYSFDDRQLNNLAPTDGIEERGKQLIADSGAHGLGLFFDGQNHLSLEGVPTGTDLDRFTFSAWIKIESDALADTSILTIGEKQRGFTLRIVEGKLEARWDRVWPQLAAVTTSNASLFVPKRWTHIAVTYDGTRRAGSLKLYLNGRLLETGSTAAGLIKIVLPERAPWHFSGKGLSLDEVQIFTEELTPLGIRHLFDGVSLTRAAPDLLRPFYQRHFQPEELGQRANIEKAVVDLLKVEQEARIFLVMADDPNRPPLVNAKMPRNRLDFAQRLNPDLLARALANEVWKQHFEIPLAHSLGFSDPLPSHPDLLEWLAGQLKESNFDVSELGKIIRASEAWKKDWPRLARDPATCPIEAGEITRSQ